MIILNTYRHYADFAGKEMFTYINNLKRTQLINVLDGDKRSNEYLLTILMHSLLDEVELLFKKKLINTQSAKVVIKMSDAAGIAFYKTLLILPVPAEHFYFNLVRNQWVEILDQQITGQRTAQLMKSIE